MSVNDRPGLSSSHLMWSVVQQQQVFVGVTGKGWRARLDVT